MGYLCCTSFNNQLDTYQWRELVVSPYQAHSLRHLIHGLRLKNVLRVNMILTCYIMSE